jgi:hypothetical protein
MEEKVLQKIRMANKKIFVKLAKGGKVCQKFKEIEKRSQSCESIGFCAKKLRNYEKCAKY